MGKKKTAKNQAISIPSERIEQKILFVREQKVMLDADLAELYEVETKALIRQIKRNLNRFPEDFMFRLNDEEWEFLRCQSGTSRTHGGRRYAPYVFTEQGVAMLSSVLRSDRAADVNIQIIRTFVKLRELLSTHTDLARKLATIERKYDQQFQVVFDAIRKLMEPPSSVPKKRRIGFVLKREND